MTAGLLSPGASLIYPKKARVCWVSGKTCVARVRVQILAQESLRLEK